MFSEEDLEGGLIFMFVGLEVSEWTGELIKVVVENVDVVSLSFFHELSLSLIIAERYDINTYTYYSI